MKVSERFSNYEEASNNGFAPQIREDYPNFIPDRQIIYFTTEETLKGIDEHGKPSWTRWNKESGDYILMWLK